MEESEVIQCVNHQKTCVHWGIYLGGGRLNAKLEGLMS